jgi:protein-S-isoprenylcysteine O-methyltransferase Ste14
LTPGQFFFKYRSYTPIPLLLAVLILADPTWASFFAGLTIMLLGESTRFWGVLYAGSATRTTGEVGAGRLVTDGPFAHIRNPLYTGNFLLSLGLTVMSRAWMPWMLLIFLLLFGIQYTFIVREEEKFLARQFDQQYAEYCQHVPRWLLNIRGFTNSELSSPVFAKALRSERNTLQSALAVIILMLIRWHLL